MYPIISRCSCVSLHPNLVRSWLRVDVEVDSGVTVRLLVADSLCIQPTSCKVRMVRKQRILCQEDRRGAPVVVIQSDRSVGSRYTITILRRPSTGIRYSGGPCDPCLSLPASQDIPMYLFFTFRSFLRCPYNESHTICCLVYIWPPDFCKLPC